MYLAQNTEPTKIIAEYQKKIADKIEKLKFEMLERMKRKPLYNEPDYKDLVKITV